MPEELMLTANVVIMSRILDLSWYFVCIYNLNFK